MKHDTRLFLIGGVSRSGKTCLAQRLLRGQHVPFLSIDVLKMAVRDGFPAAGLTVDRTTAAAAADIWPLLRHFGEHALTQRLSYCMEGDLLTPSLVTELTERHPVAVRCCFLGYPGVDRSAKASLIERFAGGPNDWLNRDGSAAARLAHVDAMKAASLRLRDECLRTGLRFVDTSDSFDGALSEALEFLTS